MKVKSYFSDSVEDAIGQARTELGPDAMLVSSRQSDIALKDLGAYEVVFGLPQNDAPAGQTQPEAKVGSAAASHSDLVLRELSELRSQVESFRQSVARSNASKAAELRPPELAHIFDRLLISGFSEDLAHELTDAVALQTRPHNAGVHRMTRDHQDLFARDLLEAVLEDEIAARFSVAPSLGRQGNNSPIVMLVGAPGTGKTSSMVKLGLQYGLRERRPLHLLSLDTLRIGGHDHLRTYAGITGCGFRALQDTFELGQAISELAGKGLTLIDTPGFAKADGRELIRLAEHTLRLEIEVHLVLPAHLNLAAAKGLWTRFEAFKPAKLIMTHLDAVESSAPAVEFAMRSGLPLSFLSAGQRVPEDIAAADKSELLRTMLPTVRAVSMAA